MFVGVILQVSFELLSIHEVCQTGPELWVFDTARFQLEPEIRVDCDEETIQPPVMDGQRVLQDEN